MQIFKKKIILLSASTCKIIPAEVHKFSSREAEVLKRVVIALFVSQKSSTAEVLSAHLFVLSNLRSTVATVNKLPIVNKRLVNYRISRAVGDKRWAPYSTFPEHET